MTTEQLHLSKAELLSRASSKSDVLSRAPTPQHKKTGFEARTYTLGGGAKLGDPLDTPSLTHYDKSGTLPDLLMAPPNDAGTDRPTSAKHKDSPHAASSFVGEGIEEVSIAN